MEGRRGGGTQARTEDGRAFMEPLTWIILLAVIGLVLLVGELLLPTHGMLGVLGVAAIAGAVGICFYLNRWVGLALFLGMVVASPVLLDWGSRMWERSFVGKRILLPPIDTSRGVIPVRLGEIGVAMSELRPSGECEFQGIRLEAVSEYGMIHRGSRVKVVGVSEGKLLTVRGMSDPAPVVAVAPNSQDRT